MDCPLLIVWQKKVYRALQLFLIGAPIPFMRALPAWPNFLPKPPPWNIIALGFGFNIWIWGGGGNTNFQSATPVLQDTFSLMIYPLPTSCNLPKEHHSSRTQNYVKSINRAVLLSLSMFTFMYGPSTEMHFLPFLDSLTLRSPTRSPYSHKSSAELGPVHIHPWAPGVIFSAIVQSSF